MLENVSVISYSDVYCAFIKLQFALNLSVDNS